MTESSNWDCGSSSSRQVVPHVRPIGFETTAGPENLRPAAGTGGRTASAAPRTPGPRRRPARSKGEIFGLTLVLLGAARVRGVPRLLERLPLLWWPIRKQAVRATEIQPMLAAVGRYLEGHAGRLPFRLIPRLAQNMCLAKTLLAAWYSCKMKFPATIHFGIRLPPGGDLKGHSWVTLPSGVLWQDDAFTEICRWAGDGSGKLRGAGRRAEDARP